MESFHIVGLSKKKMCSRRNVRLVEKKVRRENMRDQVEEEIEANV